MFEYHADKKRYFEMQYLTARDFIIPMLERHMPLLQGQRVLEIGCAEAGVLKAFLEKDLFAWGIDLNAERIRIAGQFHGQDHESGRIKFLSRNIYDIDPMVELDGPFDVILLKDVIEHIPEQEVFIPRLEAFLKKNGILFFGFPPWQMPFGGHQQMCKNKALSKMPWIHLLPYSVYKALLRIAGEEEAVIKELLEIKDTGISIERFEKILRNSPFTIKSRILFLTNPIYKFKFGLEPRKVPVWLGKIPFLRNFFTTAAYYFISKK